VLYCIGLTADFRSRPFDTMRAHVSVLTDVLENAQFESLVYLSSTRVYARNALGNENAAITVDVSDPSDLYNISKLAGEALCHSCGKPGVKVARLSNVVGYDPASENLLSTLTKEALAGRIELQSDPSSSKDYITLEDVVWLLPQIAVSGQERLYNVASGKNVCNQEIVDRLIELTGCELAVCSSAPILHFPLIDIEKVRSEFGYFPTSVLNTVPKLIAASRLLQAK
jgi:nucleoside-diphosphate-sugar epimerase